MEKYKFENLVLQEPIVNNRYVVEFLDKNIPGYLIQKLVYLSFQMVNGKKYLWTY